MVPNEIKKLNGTYREDRDKNKNVNFDNVESAKPPKFLKLEGKKNFNLLIDQLGYNGYNILTNIDLPALTLLADVYTEYIEVTKTIEKEGIIIEDYNNRNKIVKKIHPLTGYKRQLFNDLTKMLKEFGMSPSSRNKVEFKPSNNNEDSEWNF